MRIAERDVDENTLHDNEDSGTIDGDTDGGHDPVDRFPGCPSKDKQADSRTKGSGKSGEQTIFLDGETEAGDARVHEEVEIGTVDSNADQAGDENAEEDKTNLTERHVVVNGINERENLEDCGPLLAAVWRM